MGVQCEVNTEENTYELLINETIELNNDTKKESKTKNDPSSYCQTFKSCHDCVNSVTYKCGWCHNFGCTDSPVHLCPSPNRNFYGNLSCPKIAYDHSKSILVPSGIRTNLKVKLINLDPVLYDKEIVCQVKVKERVSHLKGVILGEYVYCYPIVLNIKQEQEEEGTFQLIWGGVNPLSNILPILIYKCELLGHDCESCLKIRREYGCGWCEKSGMCVIADKCSDDYMRWTLNRMMCGEYHRNLFYI